MASTPKLAFTTIVSTLAYLGLAILGSGGFSAFFSHPALTVVAIATVVMAGVGLVSAGIPSFAFREELADSLRVVARVQLLAKVLVAEALGHVGQ